MGKLGASAERMRTLIEYLEREGRSSIGEIAEQLPISIATAERYADVLVRSGLAVWGRCAMGDAMRDRKLRLSAEWKLHTVLVARTRVQTASLCPATGKRERRALTLCDAIPEDEALSALLHRVMDAWEPGERRIGRLGVIAERGVVLPSLGLHPEQIADRESLTQAGLAKEYGEKSVLYLRYGDRPQLRLLVGGVPVPGLRAETALQQAWNESLASRVDAFAEQIARLLTLLTPDAVVLESDGMRGDTVADALRTALVARGLGTDVPMPPITVGEETVAERALLDRLRMRLAEEILRESHR